MLQSATANLRSAVMALALVSLMAVSCVPGSGPGATPAPAGMVTPQPEPRSSLNYLRTDGTRIVDRHGNEVLITGISWFGFETGTLAPHGIWVRPYGEILDQITEMGFNTIRLPWSNEVLDAKIKPQGIDPKYNPDLEGLTSLEIMDRIIVAAGQRGLKVILDRHRPSSDSQSKLWYSDEMSEEQWIADWLTLVRRYKDNDTVIGVDLHNEPAGDATWGTGDPKTDWRLAAERVGNAILDVNPYLLIVVEGIEKSEDDLGNVYDWYWMGGALQYARLFPIRLKVPNRLVYSAHDYGPGVYMQGWFRDPEFPKNLPGVWDQHWGYLQREGIAPVLLGEFGGRSVGDDLEGVWQRTLIKYLKDQRIGYLYWSLNGNSGDTGGLLLEDWKSVDRAKVQALATHQGRLIGNLQPTKVDAAAMPGPRPTTMRVVKLLQKDTNDQKWAKEVTPEVHVANKTLQPMPLDGLEARYWLTIEGGVSTGAVEPTVEVREVSVGYPEKVLGSQQARAVLVREAQLDQGTDPVYSIRITFASGTSVPPRDSLAVKLVVRRKDGNPFYQENDYSYREYHWQTEWERVALYRGDQVIWGKEPQTYYAEQRAKEEARRARASAGPRASVGR
ncbi:MAG: glycoside hydrolase family 5 protein [Chloroflexi bacterium]|nr:glycoside hydrolase family 5 protein [Chloroflexota bacterium]